jgi:hypothetical protein
MKDWWQKLTIDWPCTLGDWLWAALVVTPARFIDGLTRRRVLHILGFILLLLFFQQVVMFDLTFLFGMDLGLLMEVCAAIFVLTARGQARALLTQAQRGLEDSRSPDPARPGARNRHPRRPRPFAAEK